MRPISQYYLQSELDVVLAVEQSDDCEMTECNISFLSQKSRAGAADMPDFCTENSLMLHLRQTLSASLHSLCRWGWQRRTTPYFRLIYDLCRGGCIRKISHVNRCHAATTGHEKAEEHTTKYTQMCVCVCLCEREHVHSVKAEVYYICTALAALQSEEPLSVSPYNYYNCTYYIFIWKTFHATVLASIRDYQQTCMIQKFYSKRDKL